MGHLKCDTRGWEKLKRKLYQFNEREVDVGFFKDKKYGPENGNMYVGEVAYINDQGNRLVPPRPFMTVDFLIFVRKQFAKDAKYFFQQFLQSKQLKFVPDLKMLGNEYAGELKNLIYDYPGSNSPAWAAYKGFDDPLFHTGKLVESADYRVKKPKTKE